MSASDADPDDMTEFSLPRRDGQELDAQLLDTILTGQQLSPDAPGQAAVVAEMLASLAGPADSGQLTGQDAARSAFARAAARRPGPARWRPGRRPGRLTMRLAGGLAAIAAGTSAAAAAYAGALPGPVQDLAHVAIGAPSPRAPGASGRHQPGPARSGTPPGSPAAPRAGAAPPVVTGTGKAGHRERPAGRAANTPAGQARGHSKLPSRKAGGRTGKRARAAPANGRKKQHKNKRRARNKRHRKSAG